MELQIVSFEQAKLLKDLGFDWRVNSLYVLNNSSKEIILQKDRVFNQWNINCSIENTINTLYSAPTVPLALKWCRDVKEVFCWITRENHYCYEGGYSIHTEDYLSNTKCSDSYEEAEIALLDEILEILLKEKNENSE